MTLTPKQLEFMSREIYKAEQIVARGIGRPVKLIISFDIAEDLALDHVHEFIEAICKLGQVHGKRFRGNLSIQNDSVLHN